MWVGDVPTLTRLPVRGKNNALAGVYVTRTPGQIGHDEVVLIMCRYSPGFDLLKRTKL